MGLAWFQVGTQTNLVRVLLSAVLLIPALMASAQKRESRPVLTGQDAFTDYSKEKPGTIRKLTVADLPRPFATESVDNDPQLVPRPKDAWPQAPPGFAVQQYASGLSNPRLIRTAPNGDLFLAESGSGEIK